MISYNNKRLVKLIISLILSAVVMLIAKEDAFVIAKFGKTLFFILMSLCVYFVLCIPDLFKRNKSVSDYNVIDDFYKVICEDTALVFKDDDINISSGVAVKEKIKTVSFTERNVMIGTVRSPEQLKYNLENNCYYTPARFVEKENLPVKSIAIYEADETGNMSIRRIGNVKNAKLMKRKNIPIPISRNNGDEEYWFFELEGWEFLQKPVIVKDTYRGKPLYTNSFLIDNCDYSYQLVSVSSADEYVLARALEKFLRAGDSADAVVKISGRRMLQYKNGNFIIKNNRGVPLYKMPAHLYYSRPKQMFDKLKNYVK